MSSDKTADELKSVFATKHGSWLAIAFNDPMIAALKKKYEVCAGSELGALGMQTRKAGVPSLVVVDEKGAIIDFNGADTIRRESPASALKQWGGSGPA